jgi:hypothetical protein
VQNLKRLKGEGVQILKRLRGSAKSDKAQGEVQMKRLKGECTF